MQIALMKWYNFLKIMEESPLVRLDLRAPLEYAEVKGLDPFGCSIAEDYKQESLFCFELDVEQVGRIDPEAGLFLGKLIFSGRGNNESGNPSTVRLTAGLYLFTQRRRLVNREECIYLAIEQQKDGLWERLQLENRLYIRRLFEDSSPVTQLFRPYE